jgi:DNA-binding NtrC family response regulator
MSLRVLIAEPDEATADSWRAALEAAGHRVTAARTGAEFESASRSGYDVCVMDVRSLDRQEASLLHFLRNRSPRVRVLLTAAREDGELVPRAVQRAGAAALLIKPVEPGELVERVRRLAAGRDVVGEAALPDGDAAFEHYGIVGKSAALRRVIKLAEKVAPTDTTVVITGETGAGKEIVARFIHERSHRSEGPFVTVNCGAIPPSLVESELFGHKRGSFTDAVADKKGLFELAHGGTIFLDEIAELSLSAQVKLLRVLEDLEIRRVGDTAPVRVDVRVLAATNKDLAAEAREGRFREDLWFRLNVVTIHLPPLRERREDIGPLLARFLAEANRKFGRAVVAPDPEAFAILLRYDWPGNARELRNVVEHAVVMAERPFIRVEDLPPGVVAAASRNRLLEGPAAEAAKRSPPEGAAARLPSALPSGSASTDSFSGDGGRLMTLAESERERIAWTLRRLGGNQTEAAKALGISRSTLWRKIKTYGIDV